MAIFQGMCNQFKRDIMLGVHDLDTDTIKIALYTESAELSPDTTAYTTSGETSGAGYTAGGETLTGVSVTLDGSAAIVNFNNPSWASASFTAKGALIYNASKSNLSVAVLNFGVSKTSVNQTFELQLPANTATTAVVRIA